MRDTPHIMEAFDKDINELRRTILRMSGMLEELLNIVIRALQQKFLETSEQEKILKVCRKLGKMEKETHDRTIRLVTLRQPMAMDLRQGIAALKMSTDLNRIGNYLRGVVVRLEEVDQNRVETMFNSLSIIGQRTLKMLTDVMTAYSEGDKALAVQVWYADKSVDGLYMSFFREMTSYMLEDPKMITDCLQLIFMAKNIERLGDRVTQLAETVYYLNTGQFMDVEIQKTS